MIQTRTVITLFLQFSGAELISDRTSGDWGEMSSMFQPQFGPNRHLILHAEEMNQTTLIVHCRTAQLFIQRGTFHLQNHIRNVLWPENCRVFNKRSGSRSRSYSATVTLFGVRSRSSSFRKISDLFNRKKSRCLVKTHLNLFLWKFNVYIQHPHNVTIKK